MSLPTEEFRRRPGVSGFIVDFDGTLSDIVPEPGRARAVQGATRVLSSLAAVFRVVAVLTGRRAAQVADLVPAAGVRYVGLYGAERISGGQLDQVPLAGRWRGMASRLARDAQAFIRVADLEGCEVEFKDVAVSLHFRRAESPDAGDLLLSWALEAAPRRGFEATMGRKVVELQPPGMTKAGAVESLVSEFALENLLVAGDDSADAAAFIRATELLGSGALAVAVVSSESPGELLEYASVSVESPAELLGVLDRFV